MAERENADFPTLSRRIQRGCFHPGDSEKFVRQKGRAKEENFWWESQESEGGADCSRSGALTTFRQARTCLAQRQQNFDESVSAWTFWFNSLFSIIRFAEHLKNSQPVNRLFTLFRRIISRINPALPLEGRLSLTTLLRSAHIRYSASASQKKRVQQKRPHDLFDRTVAIVKFSKTGE